MRGYNKPDADISYYRANKKLNAIPSDLFSSLKRSNRNPDEGFVPIIKLQDRNSDLYKWIQCFST
jgi:hypothetical protein